MRDGPAQRALKTRLSGTTIKSPQDNSSRGSAGCGCGAAARNNRNKASERRGRRKALRAA